MRYILFLLIFAITSCSEQKTSEQQNKVDSTMTNSQFDINDEQVVKIVFDINKLKEDALIIMNKLEIRQRINLSMDDSLKTFVDTSLNVFNATFGTINPKGVMSPENFRLRYYLTPVIKISPLMNSVVTNSKDTTSFAKLKAYSIIIHEIAHYLQEIWDNENYVGQQSAQDEKRYVSQPSEIEAYAVGAYYFLSMIHTESLNKIMLSKITIRRKYEMLIDAYREKVYPWRLKLFD